jgi:hypothetical protein
MLKPFLIALTVLAIPPWLNATDNTTTLEGRLIWASCYINDGFATRNEMGGSKECGSFSLLHGRPGGLLTKENAFYFLDAPSLPLTPYVGQQIRVTGNELSTDIFSATKAAVRKGGTWQTIEISLTPEELIPRNSPDSQPSPAASDDPEEYCL